MRAVVAVLTVLLVSACGPGEFLQRAQFPIWVEEIQTPDPIARNQPLEIVFFGHIGDSDCFSFDEFVTHKSADNRELEVAALGLFETRGVCNPADVRLDGQTLVVEPPFEDPFTIFVIQPGEGQVLEHTVRVE